MGYQFFTRKGYQFGREGRFCDLPLQRRLILLSRIWFMSTALVEGNLIHGVIDRQDRLLRITQETLKLYF